MAFRTLPQTDVLICGAGMIGLALALELDSRGANVTVLDPNAAFRQTSFAAAGMLAVHDPHNPPPLLPLSELSARLYPDFLAHLETLSGLKVPFQTQTAVQYLADGTSVRLKEHSLDPRQLSAALLAAVTQTSIQLHQHTGPITTHLGPKVRTQSGLQFHPRTLFHTSGAWFHAAEVNLPRKGQMMRVRLPPSLALAEVHRAEHIYIVPRTQGPQAGTALLGATVEDGGFDTTVHAADLAHLRALAADLLPIFADEQATPLVEAWAGIRPATPDGLPILGPHPRDDHQWIATGHFRNGILLAPATAHIMSDLIEGKRPAVDLSAFCPTRFGADFEQ